MPKTKKNGGTGGATTKTTTGAVICTGGGGWESSLLKLFDPVDDVVCPLEFLFVPSTSSITTWKGLIGETPTHLTRSSTSKPATVWLAQLAGSAFKMPVTAVKAITTGEVNQDCTTGVSTGVHTWCTGPGTFGVKDGNTTYYGNFGGLSSVVGGTSGAASSWLLIVRGIGALIISVFALIGLFYMIRSALSK